VAVPGVQTAHPPAPEKLMAWFGKSTKDAPADPSRATEADVRHAYRLLLKREPDAAGLGHYVERVKQGMPLDELIAEFVRSDEYHDRLERERLADEHPVDLGGYQILVPTRDPDFGSNIFHFRQYEEPVRQVMRDHLREGHVCIDIGANIGVMTFLAASLVGPAGLVIAVEPNPVNVQLLYRSVVLNGLTNVQVLPLAASDRRAVFSLTGRSNTHLIGARGAAGGGDFVQSVPLDELFGGLPRLDFVKLDIEGHEPPALEGMWQLIARHRPVILTEFNPRCLDVQQQDGAGYLRRLLSLYPKVRVISHFGDDETFASAEDVMAFWDRRAAETAAGGQLPLGLLHLDLVLHAG
jgi:FkbM family methyltransferase